jgi:SAM-dependent methyltransferase
MLTRSVSQETVLAHFTARAPTYDASSHWCTDVALLDQIWECCGAGPESLVLDVAVGTGLVAGRFFGRVGRLVGLDLTPAMSRPGRRKVDAMVSGQAEGLPFRDDLFDVVVERQGIQFMDAARSVKEMVRVAKPGGRVCLVQLCAYGYFDRDDYFEILRLRNPARRNFFLREDLQNLLKDAGCGTVTSLDFVSVEDVDRWSDNGAIGDGPREEIRAVYRRADPRFLKLHGVELHDGRFVDHMLFCILVGVK